MHSISTRAQFICQANTFVHTLSDRISSYLQHIKESYASFKDRLLWNEIGDVRQSSSGLKKELKLSTNPNTLLTQPKAFMRSEKGPVQKSSAVKNSPKFPKEELKESTYSSLFSASSYSVHSSSFVINNSCNKIFEKYYGEDPTLADIKTAYVGNDGQVYDVSTVAKLNGKSPITREKLAAVKDKTFIQALEQQEKTGIASAILLDAITNEPLNDPIITTDGRRINRSTFNSSVNSSVKALSNDFRLFNLLKECGLSSVLKQEPLFKQDFNELITDIRQTNADVEEQYLGIAQISQSTDIEDRTGWQILCSLVNEMIIEHNQFKAEMHEYRAEMHEYRAEMREYRAEMREYRAEMREYSIQLDETLNAFNRYVDAI